MSLDQIRKEYVLFYDVKLAIFNLFIFSEMIKQWRLHTCKIPMTTEAANLKLRRV